MLRVVVMVSGGGTNLQAIIDRVADGTITNMITLVADLGLNSKVIVSERNDPYQNPRKSSIRKMRDKFYRLADGYVFQTTDAKTYFEKKE